ncbi:MAG TPA: DUF4394 domain-containing protein [Solirubrobacteraceae bacterium]|jgi:hypothetical protein
MTRTLALAATLITALAFAAPASATTIYATSGDKLWTKVIPAPNPAVAASQSYTGLQNGEQIFALDYNPAGARLYGLGKGGGGTDGVYEIDPATAAATRLTPTGTNFTGTLGQGTGFDFNPVFTDVARFIELGNRTTRLFSDDGSGYLDAFNTGYVDAEPVDDPHEGTDPAVAGIAYTNNFHGATTSTGYVYDASPNPDVLATIPAAGDGDRLSPAPVSLTTSDSTGLNASPFGGLDIAPGDNAKAYGVFNFTSGSDWNLYTVNLDTGAVAGVPNGFMTQNVALYGMTVAPDQTARFTAGVVGADEGQDLLVPVERTATTGELDVDWEVVGGTASAGPDLGDASGTLHFDAGEATQDVVIPVTDDADDEGVETVDVELFRPTGNAMVGDPYTKRVIISASDAPPDDDGDGGGDGGGGDPPPADGGPPKGLPPVVTPPAPDAAPVISARAARQRARRARRRGIRFSLTTNEAIQLVAELRVRGRRIGRLRRSVAAGTNALVLRATRRQRRRLKPGRAVIIVLTATDAAGNVTTKTLGVRLKR